MSSVEVVVHARSGWCPLQISQAAHLLRAGATGGERQCTCCGAGRAGRGCAACVCVGSCVWVCVRAHHSVQCSLDEHHSSQRSVCTSAASVGEHGFLQSEQPCKRRGRRERCGWFAVCRLGFEAKGATWHLQ